jgi:LemA protein
MAFFVVLFMIVAFAVWVIGLYNGLVTSRNGFKNAFAQIKVQLSRRNDLIPNLVETARGHLKHERERLEAVITARNSAVAGLEAMASDPGNAGAIAQLSGAEQGLSNAMARLFAVMESYPDLKASSDMLQLSGDLAATENRIASARQAFNDAVLHYNNSREMFPGSLVAGWFSFQPANMLELPDATQRETPKASFS